MQFDLQFNTFFLAIVSFSAELALFLVTIPPPPSFRFISLEIDLLQSLYLYTYVSNANHFATMSAMLNQLVPNWDNILVLVSWLMKYVALIVYQEQSEAKKLKMYDGNDVWIIQPSLT